MSDGDGAKGNDALFEKLKRWYRDDIVVVNKWRKEAREDFRFRDGDQWSDDEVAFLSSQMRPVVVFNRTGVLVDAVAGTEVNNRREVRYVPRDQADSAPNELLSAGAEWMRDQADAEDEESAAFKDCVTAGMGWTETRLDYDENPAGDPKIDRLDPFEMVWDGRAQKPNLADARRICRVRSVDIDVARQMFPGVDDEDLNAAWADNGMDGESPVHNGPRTAYTREAEERQDDLRHVTLVHCQYEVQEPYYKAVIQPPVMPGAMAMAEPVVPQPMMVDLDPAKFKIAQASGVVLQSAKLKRKRIMQCILGAKVLKAPHPVQTETFSFQPITGLRDEDKGIFYGIVRRAKDPQRWANKWLSQMMHILNSQAKGGIMAERGAFEDDRDAEQNWAKPNGITFVTKGTLTGKKVAPKPAMQFPAGFDRLLQYADEMIIKATGINMEMLGLREVNQPGVLEYQRKQQGIAILAPFFDSLRYYRKRQGRAMLALIRDFVADGRLVRIVGDEGARYMPLVKEAIAGKEYDIIVDDAPTSPNEKEKTWQIVTSILPMFKDQLPPQAALLLAEYSPLPASFVEKIKQMIGQAQTQKQENPAQQAAMALEQGKMQLEAEKLKLEMAKVQADRERTAMEMQKLQMESFTGTLQQQTEREKIGVDRIKAYADLTQAQKPDPLPTRMN